MHVGAKTIEQFIRDVRSKREVEEQESYLLMTKSKGYEECSNEPRHVLSNNMAFGQE